MIATRWAFCNGNTRRPRMFFDSMSNGGVYPLRAGWIVLALLAVAMVAAQLH